MSCKYCGMPSNGDDIGPVCCYRAEIDGLRAYCKRLEKECDQARRELEDAKRERDALAEALRGLKLEDAMTFEGRIDAHAYFSVDALEAARAALGAPHA